MPEKRKGKKPPKTSRRAKLARPRASAAPVAAAALPGPDGKPDGQPLEERPAQPGPPVAGICASAGGLSAFKKFVSAMPSDSGVAFVLIPHLDPGHESLMVEVISRQTSMKVVEASDGTQVEANYVYIIPPNKYMTIAGGVLRLSDRKAASDAAVLAREQDLRAILRTAADAIITIDEAGIIKSVNPATERLFGYVSAEMLGQNVSMLMPSPFREEHDRYLQRYLETGRARIIGIGREVVGRRRDGSTFPADLAVSRVEDLHLFCGIVRDITRRKELEHEVVMTASQAQQRIGHDLHDRVGQELAALTLLVGDLGEAVPADPARAAGLVERIAQGLRRSQQDLRDVLRGMLVVAVGKQGLAAALTDLVDRINAEGKVTCTFDCPRPVEIADNFEATHLYFIAQEAVHNALKHAQPKSVSVSLKSNGLYALRVADDGVGMPARPVETSGLGLRIMRYRAAMIGATLSIEAAQPHGTIVTCTWSKKNDAQNQDRQKRPRPDRR